MPIAKYVKSFETLTTNWHLSILLSPKNTLTDKKSKFTNA